MLSDPCNGLATSAAYLPTISSKDQLVSAADAPTLHQVSPARISPLSSTPSSPDSSYEEGGDRRYYRSAGEDQYACCDGVSPGSNAELAPPLLGRQLASRSLPGSRRNSKQADEWLDMERLQLNDEDHPEMQRNLPKPSATKAFSLDDTCLESPSFPPLQFNDRFLYDDENKEVSSLFARKYLNEDDDRFPILVRGRDNRSNVLSASSATLNGEATPNNSNLHAVEYLREWGFSPQSSGELEHDRLLYSAVNGASHIKHTSPVELAAAHASATNLATTNPAPLDYLAAQPLLDPGAVAAALAAFNPYNQALYQQYGLPLNRQGSDGMHSNGSSRSPSSSTNGNGKSKKKNNDIEISNRFAGVKIEDLEGRLFSFCKDQHGCRFLQKKLEEQNRKTVEMIFQEIHPHFVELMTDPFGNYLCQKLLEYCNDEQRTRLVQTVAPEMVGISLNMHGTRAVQRMIEYLSTPQQIRAVIGALSGNVVTLIKDLNGNHVIQKCLNRLASQDKQFIYDAVSEQCVEVATHRHGCCVMQRCIDRASTSQVHQLAEQVIANGLTLVMDPFGNYVVQYILDLHDDLISQRLIHTNFRGNVCRLSMQKFSSNVIEKCIRVADAVTKNALLEELLNRQRLESLLRDSYGNYVVQTALDHADPINRAKLIEAIRPLLPAIRSTPYGKRIQSKIQRVERAQYSAQHPLGQPQPAPHQHIHPSIPHQPPPHHASQQAAVVAAMQTLGAAGLLGLPGDFGMAGGLSTAHQRAAAAALAMGGYGGQNGNGEWFMHGY
ncbi:uncharacterized protein VTP21DRAFT_4915 [Calcarisporiella thermophila]|uniref:uncharacterized protein n=1 Tax=Calcarisporiella thermophila TaxID=911321 RepID=UPI003742782E